MFDRWVDMIGSELGVKNEADYAVLFFADIMHDGTNEFMSNLPARMLMTASGPTFLLNGKTYELASKRGYQNFWAIYHRPPEARHRHYLLERRDSLLPTDEQKFKGAYYTPLHIVDKAYDELRATLGDDWQDRFIVWDMCAGVGNLEAKFSSNMRNVFMSTLDQADVTIMKSNPAFAGAEIFQYDYLNDDITDFGEIDYRLSNKLSPTLQQAIADAREGGNDAKPILVLINPPYAETGSGIARGDTNKLGVENTRAQRLTENVEAGYASKELFVQFLVRIQHELPAATLAMFSKLKYVNAPNFERFRSKWHARYLGGFVVHSRAFEGLNGDFPIGFLIWDQSVKEPISTVPVRVLDRAGEEIGEKLYVARPTNTLLNVWITRPAARGGAALPLSNALKVSTNPRPKRQCPESLGYLYASNNDLQHASIETLITSSIYTGGNGGGLYILPENLWQAAIVFAVRRLIKPTWLNDRDQFLQPSHPLTDEFKSDCLIWMLFNGSNLSAGADGLEWNDREWSLVNHFIPFTEAELSANGRFESDFMARHVAGLDFSHEANAVMDEGRKLWTRFHATQFPRKIRDELKLGRPDAGWYQVRRALDAFGETELTDFDPFKAAYAALTDKLRPLVYELGFLPKR